MICKGVEAMSRLPGFGILDWIFPFALYTVCESGWYILSISNHFSLSQPLRYGNLLPTLEWPRGATLVQAIGFVDSVRSCSWCIATILVDSGNLSIASRSLDTIQKFICKSIAQYIHSGVEAHHGWTSSAESPLLVIFSDPSSMLFLAFAMGRSIVLDRHINNLSNGIQYLCLPMPERRDWTITGVVPKLVSSNTAPMPHVFLCVSFGLGQFWEPGRSVNGRLTIFH